MTISTRYESNGREYPCDEMARTLEGLKTSETSIIFLTGWNRRQKSHCIQLVIQWALVSVFIGIQ